MLLSLILTFSVVFLFIELYGANKFISKYLAIIPLFLLVITFCFNRGETLDYFDYKYQFMDGYSSGQFEFGYVYLSKLLKYLGQEFESIIFLAGILLLFVILKFTKDSRYTNLVIFMYSISSLIINVTQIRNTLMYLIIILSLIFVEKRKALKHYLTVFIAFSFHNFALIYLPFFYLCRKSRREFLSLIWKILLVTLVASPIIIEGVVRLFPLKLSVYLERTPGFGILIVFIYVILDLITIWWVDKKVNNSLNETEKNKAEVLYRFVWFSILILPFTFYFLEVKRMQRNAMLVKYFYCATTMHHLKLNDKFLTVVLLLISALLPMLVMHYNGELNKFEILDKNQFKYYLECFH